MTIKKHVFAAMIVFFIAAFGTAFILSADIGEKPTKVRVAHVKSKVVVNTAAAPARPMSFANENVPLSNPKIAWRLQRTLNQHSYERLGTTMLHNKAERWFPVIEPILAEYGIPQDFKYITLVESGLREGTSQRGASGCWQFMPGTARSYGLVVNGRIDERQNMRKSTIAACKYIRELYAGLRSWTLTAAAYNLGDVKLRSQIATQKQRNYYKMKLNRETAQYVYKLISMKEIIENPKKYGYRQKRTLLASANTDDLFTSGSKNSHDPVITLSTLQN